MHWIAAANQQNLCVDKFVCEIMSVVVIHFSWSHVHRSTRNQSGLTLHLRFIVFPVHHMGWVATAGDGGGGGYNIIETKTIRREMREGWNWFIIHLSSLLYIYVPTWIIPLTTPREKYNLKCISSSIVPFNTNGSRFVLWLFA